MRLIFAVERDLGFATAAWIGVVRVWFIWRKLRDYGGGRIFFWEYVKGSMLWVGLWRFEMRIPS